MGRAKRSRSRPTPAGGSVDSAAQRRELRVEESPRATVEQYQALFEQSIDGIYLHDLDGRIIDVNRAAIAQSLFAKDELLRMSVFDFLADEVPRDAITRQWREWQASQAVIVEAHHRRKDGTVCPVEISTCKIRFGDRELMLAITRDISERKRAEQERERLEEQLRHAQKMEAVGRLAGGVAHDFNNMLCAISGNAELALRRLPAGDRLREPIEAVVAAAARAADLTRQLLAFSRKQVTEPRVIDLNQLISTVHPMLARLLGEDVVLRTVPGERLGRVRADPCQVEQVVLNLAVNARDAMPDGGELVVETADVSLDHDYCTAHGDTTPGAYVMLAVSDTGTGMDAATRSKIFEPFFTTKATGKGTGLGLATVYGIVEQSGGRIEVYSEPGQGTSFKVYFPRVLDEAEPAVSRPRVPTRGGSETVLVVEDERMVRDVAVRFLERCGYEVLAAESAAEALELARSRRGPIDLLLTDVVMAHVDGHQLASKLSALRPGLKVLYASGYTENVIVHRGVLDPGVQFIAKPYSLDALCTRVREVLDAGSAVEDAPPTDQRGTSS